MLRISIIGARRHRNGIGEYIAKYFHEHKARVTSVLGTTEESSAAAAFGLRKYGIEASPYTHFEEMVEKERPHAVVIASPPSTHQEYLPRCMDRGLHVFCEKPLIWPILGHLRKDVEGILKKGIQKRLTVAMNTQWPFSMSDYEKLCGKVEIQESNRFFIRLSPAVSSKEMIPDSVPHALSLLYSRFGEGRLSDLDIESQGSGKMNIRFSYFFGDHHCEVFINLVRKEEQPRELEFGFNDKIVRRWIDPTHYEIYFHYGEGRLKITDPLESSVIHFMKAVEQNREPFMGYGHILNNMVLLKEIYDGCPVG